MADGSKMTCPVCDSKVPEERDECPVCGVNLIPFKENLEGEINEESMEKVIDIISDEDEELFNDLDIEEDIDLEEDEEDVLDEGEEKELIDEIKDMGLSEDDIPEKKEEEQQEIITFECPVCESEVSKDADECPSCGVVFEEESEDEKKEDGFETILDMDEDFEDFKKKNDLDLEMETEAEAETEDEFDILEDIDDEEVSMALESLIDSFSKDIEEVKSSDIEVKVKDVEDDISKLEEFRETGREEDGAELVDEIEEKIDHVQYIAKRLKRCNHYLDWLSGRTDTSKLEGWIDDIHKGCEIGEYRIASKKAKETEEDIKEISQSLGLKEGEKLEKEIEEKKRKIEEDISEIESLKVDLDTTPIEKDLDGASAEKEKGDLEGAFHEVMEAKRKAEMLSQIGEKIGKIDSNIKELKNKGGDHKKFSEKIKKGKDEAKRGNFTKAEEVIKETIDEVEKRLEEGRNTEVEKKEEEAPVEEEKEEKEKEEKEKEDLFKKIQEKIPEMKSLLETAKDFGVNIEGGKDLINEAVKHTKENEYEKAIESLDDCSDFFQTKLDKKVDEEIKEMEESENEKIQSIVDEIKKHTEKNNYEKVSGLIEKGKKKRAERKESLEPIRQKISEVKSMINKGEEVGLEFPKALHMLDQAKKKCEEGNTVESKELIDKAQDKAFQKLEDVLKSEIKDAREELKRAKIQGANISRPVELLKETNRAQKKGDLKECLNNFKNFKEKMEEIREKL